MDIDMRRLGYLMLYDDSEQLEVRHVIPLAHHDVEIYAGGQPIPEGELWIKRNCIKLNPRPSLIKNGEAKPFFFFSDNCSEKEDFYHAILQSQEWKAEIGPNAPLPQKFDTPDLVKLVQQLHATEENLHTRWINALIGRLFLAVYKTQDVDRMIWTKISKKIARVPKPALISGINVQRIDMGHLPPFITNPKLRELTVDGDTIIEADISYKGSFRLDISALARIDLGTRLKAREVTFVLATILRKLEGHILIRIKPPPSNRLWVTFETAPKMTFSLEPIVSSRQITYGVILRAIESRIREVVNETLVFPNWDDIPFTSTESQSFRGGVWEQSKTADANSTVDINLDASGEATEVADLHSATQDAERSDASSIDTTKSAPVPSVSDTLHSRRSRTSTSTSTHEDISTSSSVDQRPRPKPRAMRSSSFATIASPVISENSAIPRNEGRPPQDDAAESMKTTISKSPPLDHDSMSFSPTEQTEPTSHSSTTTPSPELVAMNAKVRGMETSSGFDPTGEGLKTSEIDQVSTRSDTSITFEDIIPSSPSGSQKAPSRQSTINPSLVSATAAAAKKWISARQAGNTPRSTPADTINKSPKQADDLITTSNLNDDSQTQSTISQTDLNTSPLPPLDSPRSEPFGRGMPLPPPGTPLPPPPKPERRTWNVPVASAIANFGRRKPVATTPTKSPSTAPDSMSIGNNQSDHGSLSPNPLASNGGGSQHAKTDKSSISIPGVSGSSPLPSSPSPPKPSHQPQILSRKPSDSPPPPPLPARRRQRLSSVATIDSKFGSPVDTELLVVAAPIHDSSAPPSPAVGGTFTDVENVDRKGEEAGQREGDVSTPSSAEPTPG
ncbi:unnamed protein product [Periconia digitata]|uniref:SMP-LTD domain-containing protein n=1 Tax=Periconia digitata TaxID=1303443 RepID=A0A9W4UKN6_9PLEO|nr:unnamed protein product [Periconia digitata]